MVALLVGAAACAETADAQTPEPAQDDTLEALRTRANAGDADAQANLGLMYAFGQGVPQDDVEAYKWLNLAATYADAEQRERFAEGRDTAAERLTPKQLAEGQKLSRKWLAAHPPE